MSKYLLEIGTEELPYKFIPSGRQQIQALFEKFFKDNAIEFNNIKTFGTPRRLTIVVDGLQDKQPDVKKSVKGPILNVAMDSNKNYTKAAVLEMSQNRENGQAMLLQHSFHRFSSAFRHRIPLT